MENNLSYFKYLKSRSALGFIYRKYFLYPLLQKNLSKRVLDVGCGIGDYLKFNEDAIGVDINSYNIKYLKELNLNAILMKPDLLPFEDSFFPSVLMDNVLEHIGDPNPIMHEIYRVLSPGGNLMIGVPGIKGFLSDSDHKVFYKEIDLIHLASRYNFNFLKTIITPLPFKFLSNYSKRYCIYSLFYKK